MSKINAARVLCFVFCMFLVAIPFVRSDTVISQGTVNYFFSSGEQFIAASTTPNANVTFTVANGTLNATGQLFISNTTGSLTLLHRSDGNLSISTQGNVTLFVDSSLYTGNFSFSSGSSNVITWIYSTLDPSYSESDLVSFLVIGVVVAVVVVAVLVMHKRKTASFIN